MKIKDIVLLKEVIDDLKNGEDFYNEKEEGIGDYFWDNLVSDIESLIIYSGVHSKKLDLYRMPAKRFPYAIYYDIKDEVAYVLAVLPMRRNPVWIEKELKDRN